MIQEKKAYRYRYGLLYLFFIILNALPPLTQKPYLPEQTQDVIISLLRVSIEPFAFLGVYFHLFTLLLIYLVYKYQERTGRLVALYMGINLIIVAWVQSMGMTEKYGFVLHTGAFLTALILGTGWIVIGYKKLLQPSFRAFPRGRLFLVPLAILAFWAPYDALIQPNFDPMLLLVSADYGLSFCFTMSVFIYALILFFPKVPKFMYKITMFNGVLYGLFNMAHFFDPQIWWMGVLHLPLLILSLYGMFLGRKL